MYPLFGAIYGPILDGPAVEKALEAISKISSSFLVEPLLNETPPYWVIMT